ncbi:MAG: hypothetical protein WCC01_03815 [Acidimicrobiia bacterium]
MESVGILAASLSAAQIGLFGSTTVPLVVRRDGAFATTLSAECQGTLKRLNWDRVSGIDASEPSMGVVLSAMGSALPLL